MGFSTPHTRACPLGYRPPPAGIYTFRGEGRDRVRVLDVGCGRRECAILAGLGYEVWGIDITPKAIEKVRTRQKSAV